jgi:hypothetical protein
MQKNVNALTEAEKVKLANIRNALPKPDANTLMQKVIPKDVIDAYLSGGYTPQVRGSVTEAKDAKHLKTFEDLYYGLRLDYPQTRFFIEDGSCGVVRFKSTESNIVITPTGGTFDNWEYPFTSTGFTSGSNGRLGAPEWNLQRGINLDEGAEIWEIHNDGTEILKAVYKRDLSNKLKFIEIK